MGVKIKCLHCGDIIESQHVHDFRTCKCKKVFIDGGNHYLRTGGEPNKDFIIVRT